MFCPPRFSLDRLPLLAAVVALAILGRSQPGLAAEMPMPDQITADVVQSHLRQLEESQEIEASLKTKIRESYQQALRELDAAKTWTEKMEFFQKMSASAQPDLVKARADLAQLPPQPTATIPRELTVAEFDQAISRKDAGLLEDRNELTRLEAEPKRRAGQRVEIPKAVAAARERLADIEKQFKTPPPAEESAALTAARRVHLQTRKQAAAAEIAACEKEIAAYEATAEVLSVRRDLATRRVALAEEEIKQWRQSLNHRREREAEKQAERAQIETTQVHPAVRKLAQNNAELAELRKGLAQHIADTTQELEQVRQRLGTLKDQFKRVRDKVEAVGPTNTIGLLLRKQRDALPNVALHRRNIAGRQAAIREGQLALLQFQDRRSALANMEIHVRTVLDNLGPAGDQARRGELEAAVRELLTTEKEYLDALIGDHNSYFEKLVDLDNAERQLIQEAETCSRYIEERVLWIGSAAVVSVADLRHAGDAIAWLLRPEEWHALGAALAADARRNPVPPLAAALLLIPLLRWHGRLRRRAEAIGERAAKANCCRFLPTLETLLLTALTPVVVPSLLWYAGWRLSTELDASEFCKAVGAGLAAMAKVYLVFELLRQVCRAKGLGEAHFGWNPAGLKALRAQVQWFLLGCVPLTFLASVMAAQENERWRDSLGRLSFMASAILFALFVQRALRPEGSVFEALLDSRRGGWLDRLRYVWYPLVVLHPLVLAAAAGAGYFYTSQHLARRIFTTIYLLLGLMLLRAVLMRWALVNRRKLAIEQARKRRAAQVEAGGGPETAASGLPAPADPHHDLATINSQTRRLIDYALGLGAVLAVWFAWVDVLPALRALDRVQLWQSVVNVTETVRAPDGSTALRTVERLSAVTLADLGLAALVLATTLIAARNIPGLLEMGLLHHLRLDAGTRYAVGAVSRYLITIVGIVLASNAIGLCWARVQWLLAAVGVGLGFGLQEIFANFVSGLIILFERPIRVGDVVTMDGSAGGITGVVSRIRMRATTITNGDRKELIIPNKEFITGRVLNWTLTDQVNRVVIQVGVAYGSDTQRVTQLLLKVAGEHPAVLRDPPPTAALAELGPSALNFVLHCFLPSLENRLDAMHQLHVNIERTFRETGIKIAFPQQDVHVRSIHVDAGVLHAVGGEGEPHALHVAEIESARPAA